MLALSRLYFIIEMSCESSAGLFDPCLQDSQGALLSICMQIIPQLFSFSFTLQCAAHNWRLYLSLDSLSFLHILPPPLPSATPLSFQPVNLTQLALHYISVILLLNTKPQQSRTKDPAVHYYTALMCTVTLTATYYLSI